MRGTDKTDRNKTAGRRTPAWLKPAIRGLDIWQWAWRWSIVACRPAKGRPPMNHHKVTTAVIAGCALFLFLACFWPVLFLGRQFAFRDVSDFYYPLYERVQQEWRAGRLPLWSPEENGGMPLLGNPTAAVLYPGKLVYAALPYPWAARVYILGHVLRCFAAIRGLLRHWGVSRVGAGLGALAYAYGAPVLTQYCNVVFLIGAAWMPLGFLAADRWIRGGQRSSLGLPAVVCCSKPLGGDPQDPPISRRRHRWDTR